MLKHLSIKNYAIIDALSIAFDTQLNIITGETGAGKSIIVGALNMILGKRADTAVLRDSDRKGIIEGTFEIGPYQLQDLFTRLDLDYEDETILRREIRPNGKSRAFVNDSPVTLDQLRELTGRLVDLHAQHDTTAVLKNRFYIAVLDRLAAQQDQVGTFRTDWLAWKADQKKLLALKDQVARQLADQDYLEFQFNELQALQLTPDDGAALEEELNLLENAGAIIEQLQEAVQLLEDGEVNALEILSETAQHLGHLAGFSEQLKALSERMKLAILEISDISRELSRTAEITQLDEDRLAEVEQRFNAVQRLLQKHKQDDVEELIALRDALGKQLADLEVSEADIAGLEKRVTAREAELVGRARELSAKRSENAAVFTGAIADILRRIGMPHARLELRHTVLDNSDMKESGIDNFQLEFSANKGIPLQPLKQVASGGERSRLMLAIKSVMAEHMQLPTMIFDEIDTGISGEVAGKVGETLKTLSASHQVISITHLPQIAAQATAHYYVYKDHSQETTATMIRCLDEEAHVLEVAKMLSGDQPGEAAISTARELIGA